MLKRSADSVKKDDLEEFAILGTGTFGKVKLVKHRPSGQTFAMKIISKQKVIQYNQQVGVMPPPHRTTAAVQRAPHAPPRVFKYYACSARVRACVVSCTLARRTAP